VVELCWRDPTVSDDAVVDTRRKIAPSTRAQRELPRTISIIGPSRRRLAVRRERFSRHRANVGVAAAALAAIALEPRRCRYVLSAMPTWKGHATGARLARVLRSNAGALFCPSTTEPRAPSPTGTATGERGPLDGSSATEAEAAIATPVGDLTAAELLRRIASGAIKLEEGVMRQQ